MIQAGKNITLPDDRLQKVEMAYFYNAVRNPRQELREEILQLRRVLAINPGRYRELKKRLPYVVAGMFNPPVRKTENFAWIDHIILDIDHLSAKELNAETLKSKLCCDPRVELLFLSPGGDGIKVFFRLAEKLYDHGKFSLFYNVFSREFSTRYGIEQVTDKATRDVTRACFFSFDPDTYYNHDCERVRVSEIIDFESHKDIREARKITAEDTKKEGGEEDTRIPLDEDKLTEIKKKLGVRVRTKHEKIIYVPEELEETIGKVVELAGQFDITTVDVTSIHYGKKFRFSLENKMAEVNLFYGKNGFSVVKTPKRGVDHELNDVVFKILCSYFYGGS